MWPVVRGAAFIVLAAVTPGAALSAISAWTPVVLAAAALAGASAATAVLAYRKAADNGKRLAAIERKLPKRSTDGLIATVPNGASAGVPQTPPATTAGSEIAPLHQGEERRG
jgi:hypothetical protein